jgi:hypothetical protein
MPHRLLSRNGLPCLISFLEKSGKMFFTGKNLQPSFALQASKFGVTMHAQHLGLNTNKRYLANPTIRNFADSRCLFCVGTLQ